MSDNTKNRMPELDIAKGIAILLVIALHCITLKKEYYMILAGLFGFLMPFFFFIAGYNYHPGKHTFKENIIKRSKQILPPYFIYLTAILFIAGIYYVLTNQFTVQDILAVYLRTLLTRPLFKYTGLTVPSGANSTVIIFWFIQAFYIGSIVFFAVADYCLKDKKNFIVGLIGLTGISMIFAHFDIKLPFFLSESCAIAAMMLLGAFFGQHKLLHGYGNKKWIIINSIISYAAYVILAYIFKGEGLFVGGNLWTDKLKEWGVPLTVLFSLIGSYPYVHFCRLFTKSKFLSNIFEWYGRNSFYMLFIHQLIQLYVSAFLKIEPFRMSLFSEINDPKTFLLYILVVIFSSLFVLLREKFKAHNNISK